MVNCLIYRCTKSLCEFHTSPFAGVRSPNFLCLCSRTASPDQLRRLEAEEAEKRVKDRIQQRKASRNNEDGRPSSPPTDQRILTASEKRALEAEKRAAWRQQRMRELEEDAMKAQVVIAQVKAMSASSLEALAINSPDGDRKSSASDNELHESGLRRSSSSSTNRST